MISKSRQFTHLHWVSLLKFAAIALPLCGFLMVLFWWRVNLGAERFFQSFAWLGATSYHEIDVGWRGQISVARIEIVPYGLKNTDVIRAEGLVLTTPGLWWLLKLSFATDISQRDDLRHRHAQGRLNISREPPAFAHASKLQLDVDSFSVAGNAWEGLGLNWLGNSSAAAFDSAGCVGASHFSDLDLVKFGLPSSPTSAQLRFEALSEDRALIEMSLRRADSAEFTYTANAVLDNVPMLLDTSWQKIALAEQRFYFKDIGFNSARNNHCAARLNESRRAFAIRHTNAVKAKIAALEIDVNYPALEAYTRFATYGGEMLIVANPSLAKQNALLGTLDLAQYVDYANFSLDVSGRKPVQIKLTPITKLTELIADSSPNIGKDFGLGNTPLGQLPTDDSTSATESNEAKSLKTAAPLTKIDSPVTAPALSNNSSQIAKSPAAKFGSREKDNSQLIELETRSEAYIPTEIVSGTTKSVRPTIAHKSSANSLEGKRVVIHTRFNTVRQGTVERDNSVAVTVRVFERNQQLSVVIPRRDIRSVQVIGPEYRSSNAR